MAWGWENGYKISVGQTVPIHGLGLGGYASIRYKSRIKEGLTLASCVIATAIGTLLEISSQRLMPMNDVAEAGSHC
jgi:hypothetical protein